MWFCPKQTKTNCLTSLAVLEINLRFSVSANTEEVDAAGPAERPQGTPSLWPIPCGTGAPWPNPALEQPVNSHLSSGNGRQLQTFQAKGSNQNFSAKLGSIRKFPTKG